MTLLGIGTVPAVSASGRHPPADRAHTLSGLRAVRRHLVEAATGWHTPREVLWRVDFQTPFS